MHAKFLSTNRFEKSLTPKFNAEFQKCISYHADDNTFYSTRKRISVCFSFRREYVIRKSKVLLIKFIISILSLTIAVAVVFESNQSFLVDARNQIGFFTISALLGHSNSLSFYRSKKIMFFIADIFFGPNNGIAREIDTQT